MLDPVKEIKEKLDIVDVVKGYIQLQSAGKNFKAVCPFHNEKTPSFIVSPDRQTWHCFGSCNEGGDIFSFVMKKENVEFYEALKMLAEKAGIDMRKISPASQKEFGVLYDINNSSKDFFVEELKNNGKVVDYLRSRGLKKDTIEDFEIGFAPDAKDNLTIRLVNLGYSVEDIERAGVVFKTDKKMYIDRFRGRIMFPIYNTFGKIVGFSGRILPELDNGNLGKYVNSPETPIFNKSRVLYGFHASKQFIKNENGAVIVEGQIDFLMMYQDGIKNVVATSGTALTIDHLVTLRKFCGNIILAFDSDKAGISATERAIDIANGLDFNVKIFSTKEAKDAAEYIEKNPGKIRSKMNLESINALNFYIKMYFPEAKVLGAKEAIRKILAKAKMIQSPLDQAQWVKKISEIFNVPERAVSEELEILKRKISAKSGPSYGGEGQKSQLQSGGESQEKVLEDRHDMLAAEAMSLALLDGGEHRSIVDYKIYFPEKFIGAIEFFFENNGAAKEKSDISHFIEMKSALKAEEFSLEKLNAEIVFLLNEMKKEFLRKQRDDINFKIKEVEKTENPELLSELLKRFDEISKLLNNG